VRIPRAFPRVGAQPAEQAHSLRSPPAAQAEPYSIGDEATGNAQTQDYRDVPSIEQFWCNWLHELSNAVRAIEATFRELLDLEGKSGSRHFADEFTATEPAPELVNA
jgi:hypothetical protein